MSTEVVYWAERALNQPYVKKDPAPLALQYRRGMIFCSAISLCAAAGFSITSTTLRHNLFKPPESAVFVLEEIPYQSPPIVLPQLAPALTPTPSASVPTIQQRTEKPAEPVPTRPAAPVEATKPVPPRTEPVKARPTTPTPVPTPTPVKPAAQQSPEPREIVILRKMESSTKDGVKPVDIAPAEKFGIKKVETDGITLSNGLRFKVGQRLPNGEMIQQVDPQKGLIETDRRTMVTQ